MERGQLETGRTERTGETSTRREKQLQKPERWEKVCLLQSQSDDHMAHPTLTDFQKHPVSRTSETTSCQTNAKRKSE